MGQKELEELKKRMGKHEGESKPAPNPPADGGDMSGERGRDPRPRNHRSDSQSGGVPDGQKSMPEKQVAAEGVIQRAKAEDVEDMREETSDKGVRHDLVIPNEPNIPPTVQQERMRMGQHPVTGEPWSREEEKSYKRQTEKAREDHARAVKESEQQMQKDQAVNIQPVPHVPTAHLTEEQRKAMQASQDRGESPVMQARARDNETPEKRGERMAMDNQISERDKQVVGGRLMLNPDADDTFDKDVEKKEIEGDEDEFDTDDDDDDESEDADVVEEKIERKN